ncbi:hypothetical protein Mapa_003588 [Marchantia paleacea]|nr:hypothetical protein Mapa_003588 [Marchantia paleacea]
MKVFQIPRKLMRKSWSECGGNSLLSTEAINLPLTQVLHYGVFPHQGCRQVQECKSLLIALSHDHELVSVHSFTTPIDSGATTQRS